MDHLKDHPFWMQNYSAIINSHLPDTQLYVVYAQAPGHYLSSWPNIQFLSFEEVKDLFKAAV